ncbi:MAG: hypothetical protein SFX73_23005 [Kofleriaceae bacterium]|nr:hypothetical protein [Kofleriaceae bacterium]
MLLRTLLLATLVLGFVSCGDEEPEAFPTYQACFDEFWDTGMGLPVRDTILECCLSHPIDGVTPACGPTAPDCINYLTANLSQTSASTVEVMETCAIYADQL